MKRRLVLHIGNPKAGSTSLQEFFFRNRKILLEHGILYPVAEGETSQSHAALPKSVSRAPLGPNQGKMTFGRLAEAINESPANTVVVSSEFFTDAHRMPAMIDRVNDLARRLLLDVTVIACVRPQHLWFNSSYTQSTKNLRNEFPFDAFCERSLRLARYDVMKVFGIWMGGIAGEFLALPFSAPYLVPSLEAAFFRTAGLPESVAVELAGSGPMLANVSPGPMTILASREIACRINLETAHVEPKRKSAARFVAQESELHGWNSIPFQGLTDPIKSRIWMHFLSSNDLFATRAWKKPWSEIFAVESARHFESNELAWQDLAGDARQLLAEVVRGACEAANIPLS